MFQCLLGFVQFSACVCVQLSRQQQGRLVVSECALFTGCTPRLPEMSASHPPRPLHFLVLVFALNMYLLIVSESHSPS